MIRILIADDHAIVRAGLKQFIVDQPDMSVTGEAATGSEAISLVRASDFDVVLLDAPKDNFKSLASVDAKKIIAPDFSQDNKSLVASVREAVLKAVGDARQKDWEAFLAQREPEKREPNPNVANYERRPEPHQPP